MCQFCEESGIKGPRPFGHTSGFFSKVNLHTTPAQEEKAAQGQDASGEQIDEAAMSSEGRDLLGLLRVSAAFGSTSEFTPVTVRFIGMVYGATPDDMATLQRYVAQNMRPTKAPASDPGETIAQAVMSLFGIGG